jgi:hypothetical protein
MLRRAFRYEQTPIAEEIEEAKQERAKSDSPTRRFNPAFVAAMHVIWPRYSIVTRPHGARSPLVTIDESYHFESLATIDQETLRSKAAEWKYDPKAVRDPKWLIWDWHDNHSRDGTGSRLRLVIPSVGGVLRNGDATVLDLAVRGMRLWELATLVESQLELPNRQRYTVRGMLVPELPHTLDDVVQAGAGMGAWVWVDLAGSASPRLTADRRQAVCPTGDHAVEWRKAIHGLYDRWLKFIADATATPETRADLRVVLAVKQAHRDIISAQAESGDWLARKRAFNSVNDALAFTAASFAADIQCQKNRSSDRHHRSLAFQGELERDIGILYYNGIPIGPGYHEANARDNAIKHSRALRRSLALESAVYDTVSRAQALADKMSLPWIGHYKAEKSLSLAHFLGNTFQASVELNLLNEGFWPSSKEGYPPLRLPTENVLSCSGKHISPVQFNFGRGASRRVNASIDHWEFDLILPFSAMACRALRQRFPQWERERNWRTILMLPLIVPDERFVKKFTKSLTSLTIPDYLHAFFPSPDIWDTRFAYWRTDDWRSGYSVQWVRKTGDTLWAIGAVRADDMKNRGLPLKDFVRSKALLKFRKNRPDLFDNTVNK